MNTGLLKIVRNLFLEKEELNRFYGFINDRFNVFMKHNTDRYGIIGADSFLVEAGTNAGTIKFSNDSYAIDSFLNFIQQKAIDNISTSALTSSLWYWLKIAYTDSVYEIGSVNVDVDGVVTGTDTEFLNVIRGQSAKAPSRITLYENDIKLGDYEVIDVSSNLIATINSSFGIVKTGLKYAVTGTFTLGETIPNSDKNIFVYDSVAYTFVAEDAGVDIPPTGLDIGNEFYIARIYKSGGTLTIQDKRDSYFYLDKGQSAAIQKAPLNSFKGFGENFYLWGCEVTGDISTSFNVAEGLMILGGNICYCPTQTLTTGTGSLTNYFFVIDTQVSTYDQKIAKLKYYAGTPATPYICLNDVPTPVLAKQIQTLLNSLTDTGWHYIGDLGEPDTTFASIKNILNPQRARFRKDAFGNVYIECYATGDVYDGTLFTLPVNYRPDRVLQIFSYDVSGNYSGSISTSGVITMLAGSTDLYLNTCFKSI